MQLVIPNVVAMAVRMEPGIDSDGRGLSPPVFIEIE